MASQELESHEVSSSTIEEHPIQIRLTEQAGKKLHCRYWQPTSPCSSPSALVMLIHGFAEHLAVYDELGLRLAAQGALVFGHDHVGHGLSEGLRAHVESIDEYVADVLHHVQLMRHEHPNIPLFAVAHSMGGMILLTATLKEPEAFSGIVLMGPLIHLNPLFASPVLVWTTKVLSRYLPQLAVGSLSARRMTSDLEMQKKVMGDPLIWKQGVRIKWATATHSCLSDLNNQLGSIKVPFLILHGELDQLCSIGGSRQLYEQAVVKDKEIKIFPKAQHHLYLESLAVREEALMDTVQWISQRIQNTST